MFLFVSSPCQGAVAAEREERDLFVPCAVFFPTLFSFHFLLVYLCYVLVCSRVAALGRYQHRMGAPKILLAGS